MTSVTILYGADILKVMMNITVTGVLLKTVMNVTVIHRVWIIECSPVVISYIWSGCKLISSFKNPIISNMYCRRRDDGATEVIGFIIILAMIAAVLLVWVVFSVPLEGASKENRNTLEIVDQFSEFTYGMDTLWQTNYTGVTRGTMFTLYPGTRDAPMLPLVTPAVGAGTLRQNKSNTHIAITGETTGLIYPYVLNEPVGVLEYVSAYHYADNIYIRYDAGVLYAESGTYNYTLLPPSVGGSSDGKLLIVIPYLNLTMDNPNTLPEWNIGGTAPVGVNYRLNSLTKYSENITITVSTENSNLLEIWNKTLSYNHSGYNGAPIAELPSNSIGYTFKNANVTVADYTIIGIGAGGS